MERDSGFDMLVVTYIHRHFRQRVVVRLARCLVQLEPDQNRTRDGMS